MTTAVSAANPFANSTKSKYITII